jgi:Ca2+-binding EF-hand superfamily protein
METRYFIGPSELADRLRVRCDQRGLVGLRGLGTLFRQAEENEDQDFTPEKDIPKILADFGVFMNRTEVIELARHFDTGAVSLTELLDYFVPPLPENRKAWVTKAYNTFDPNGQGSIELAKIRRLSQRGPIGTRLAVPPNSPEVLFQKLIRYYDSQGENAIPKEEFFDYYRVTSANLESDREFIALIKNTWGVSF